ncbi:hypothetical protein ABZT16_21420 [Streptomyces flaveolus]|uniref:Uncharacterized protein n=1 Tax=Streptomyces flaveolus TaxID=67297 RepID=A0ABV3AED1_9ACTN|nr:hypothetical protein [Streptomyces antibioticus]KMS90501.1 hypothetical protein ACZ91_14905 [Streptomyces regensis]KOG70034.1 hypothetical protein ADK77_12385 [Streptomyces antibioticus]
MARARTEAGGAHSSTDAGRRTGSRIAVAVAVLAVVAGGVYGGVALKRHGDAGHARPAGVPSAQTTLVRRTDLSDSKALPGTLGYGAAVTVKGAGKGLITKLPASGSTVTRGKPLYWVDDQPVTVFYGDTPVFRTLDGAAVKAGASGADVTVLADNLKALGYDIGPEPRTTQSSTGTGKAPGAVLTPSLLDALKRWQRDTGRQQTGTLSVGQVVVLPGAVRVGAVKAQLGDPAEEDVLSVTSLRKSVAVTVEAGDAARIHQGDKVFITLPDTKQVPGKVTSVGTTVQGGPGDASDASDGDTSPSLRVTVVPEDSASVENLDAASVRVTFTTETRKNVLTVPVGALLALQEGGYALQRPGGELVAVKTGLFARGQVEVSGAGIEEGQRVVTAS